MSIPYGFHQGNRSEYLAIPALCKLGFVVRTINDAKLDRSQNENLSLVMHPKTDSLRNDCETLRSK